MIDNLTDNIVELELDCGFNLKLENLPISIRKIIFDIDSKYDKELNCLPYFVEFLQLPKKYNKRILNLPKELKEIMCSKDYEYIDDFTGVSIMHY